MSKYLIIFFFLTSCSYPDIDTIPNFSDVDLTKEESIDLCEFTYSNEINLIFNCIKNVKEKILLKEITELCKSKYSDIILIKTCIDDKYNNDKYHNDRY